LGKVNSKTEIFETVPIPYALAVMAIPTIVSQLIILLYNIADTWFIGRTKNPYMVGASSLVLTVFLIATALSNLFGVGGGSLVVRLLGRRQEDEAKRVASLSLSLAAAASAAFSLLCFIFADPLLRLLGASGNTMEYARQYLLFVVIIGGFPTTMSMTMGMLLRNVGYSREAAFGMGFGGVLNILLDPIFMFVILPDGYQVMGAAIATMLSNVAGFIYFLYVYRKIRGKTVLSLPRRIESMSPDSARSFFSVGVPAALSVFLFDLTNMLINRLSSGHGDIELAAIGIVLKVERLPLNIGIGICLGMAPLVAYNYASKNFERMRAFFTAARTAGIIAAAASVVLYRVFAADIIRAFIDEPDTVAYGTEFLRARCFATPFMFLSFHMVYFMQAVDRGRASFVLAVVRQLFLNIPILLLLNRLFGMSGIVWTQVTADLLNVIVSYYIYSRMIEDISDGALSPRLRL